MSDWFVELMTERQITKDLLAALEKCIVALDMDDRFGDDIDARHAAEESAFYAAREAIAKAKNNRE